MTSMGGCWAMLQDTGQRIEPGKECGGIVRAPRPLTKRLSAECGGGSWLPFQASNQNINHIPFGNHICEPFLYLSYLLAFPFHISRCSHPIPPCLHSTQSLPAQPSSQSPQTRLFNMAQLG